VGSSLLLACAAGCGNVLATNPIWVCSTQLQVRARLPAARATRRGAGCSQGTHPRIIREVEGWPLLCRVGWVRVLDLWEPTGQVHTALGGLCAWPWSNPLLLGGCQTGGQSCQALLGTARAIPQAIPPHPLLCAHHTQLTPSGNTQGWPARLNARRHCRRAATLLTGKRGPWMWCRGCGSKGACLCSGRCVGSNRCAWGVRSSHAGATGQLLG